MADLKQLLEERASLLANLEQILIFMKDEILAEYMIVGIARPVGVLDPKTNKMTANVSELRLPEAQQFIQQQLDNNAKEIYALTGNVPRPPHKDNLLIFDFNNGKKDG